MYEALALSVCQLRLFAARITAQGVLMACSWTLSLARVHYLQKSTYQMIPHVNYLVIVVLPGPLALQQAYKSFRGNQSQTRGMLHCR